MAEEEQAEIVAEDEELVDDEVYDDDPYYIVRPRFGTSGDIHTACRMGDLQRVRHMVEHDDVDVNRRDAWDSVCLYYACLAGHVEVVRYLLEAGAVCNEHTFDGDRCHYAALHLGIRHLLRQYEARPPPLSPLASALRHLSPLGSKENAREGLTSTESASVPFADFEFVLGGVTIPLHRAMLAARSPYFDRMLRSRWHTHASAGDTSGPAATDGATSHRSQSDEERYAGGTPHQSYPTGNHRTDKAAYEQSGGTEQLSQHGQHQQYDCSRRDNCACQADSRTSDERGDVGSGGCSTSGSSGSRARSVTLSHPAISPDALYALLVYLYTERVDVPTHEVDNLRLLAKKCRLRELLSAIDRELSSIRREYKSTRAEVLPQRLVLQPWAIAPEHRLAADLRRLRRRGTTIATNCGAAAATSPAHATALPAASQATAKRVGFAVPASHVGNRAAGTAVVDDDFADVVLRGGGRVFRCTRCILTSRSEFFKTLFERHHEFGAAPDTTQHQQAMGGESSSLPQGTRTAASPGLPELPVYELGDVSGGTLDLVLEWVYSDALPLPLPDHYCTPQGLEELLHAAELMLLFPLKRAAAEAVLAQLSGRPGWDTPPLDLLCRFVLLADMFSVRVLREFCLGHLARRFDELVDPERSSADLKDVATFDAFVRCLLAGVSSATLQDAELLLAGEQQVAGASHGNIEGGGVGGLGQGTILQDLREAYLERTCGSAAGRDTVAAAFDAQLLALVARVAEE